MQATARIEATAAEASIPGRLFDKAAFSQIRYPQLQTVFERMVLAAAENLREVCAQPPQLDFSDLTTEALGPLLDRAAGNAVAAIFSVPEWNARTLFLVDRAFVYTIAELLFGGDGTEPPFEEERRFSQIEKNIAKAVLVAASKALQTCLAPVVKLTFALERIETNLAFAMIDGRDSPAVVASFDLSALMGGGRMQIVIPQAATRAARRRMERAEDQAETATDNAWSRQMQDKIESTEVTLRAILEEMPMTLSEVAKLRVGQVLPLESSVNGRIVLECNQQPLFRCEVGQTAGAYTLRVDEVLERPSGSLR